MIGQEKRASTLPGAIRRLLERAVPVKPKGKSRK
jgi:hypothetical protein